MKQRSERPFGYRILGNMLEKKGKAIRFEYYGWKLWLPSSAVIKVSNGPYCAPAWAIDSAKEHGSAECAR